MSLQEMEQKLLGLMNGRAVEENRELRETVEVYKEQADSLMQRLALARLREREAAKKYDDLTTNYAALLAQKDAAPRDWGEELNKLQNALQVEQEARDAMQEERDELIRLVGAEWRDDADGHTCAHFPLYDARGEVLAMLPAEEWIEARKACALQIQMLQDNEDINEFSAHGETENALLHGIRAALEHVEAGRDHHAKELLRKLTRKVKAAPITPVDPEAFTKKHELPGELEDGDARSES